MRLVEGGLDAEITYLTVGPAEAGDGLRKALAMGGDDGVHVLDDALHGSDALATSLVLAKALEHIGFDLVLAGMASTDAEMSVVPGDGRRPPRRQPGHVRRRAGRGRRRRVHPPRGRRRRPSEVAPRCPAVVSVTDQTGEARYPAFKAIMMAKKKPVDDPGRSPTSASTRAGSGSAAAATRVRRWHPTPAAEAGTVVVDDGTGAAQLADFLVAQRAAC